MAATSSPVLNTKKAGDPVIPIAASNGSTTPQRSLMFEMPKQNLRGLNKPKCIKCGNVARSRCPFQSCKSCCSKAQNPCHIHVLKTNGTLPDKPPPSNSPASEMPTTDGPSNGASWRLNSLRQLSSAFVNTLRARKPLSRKDAISINKWRMLKFREHIQGEIETENQAFDRYMQNVSLLEETFPMLLFSETSDQLMAPETDPLVHKTDKLISEIKLKLRSDPEQVYSFRKRIRNIVDQKLGKLQARGVVDEGGMACDDEPDASKGQKRVKRTQLWNDLINKLNKARSEDDLKPCLEMKLQLFSQTENNGAGSSTSENNQELLAFKQSSDNATPTYSLPKAFNIVDIDQDSLVSINAEFSPPCQIAEL